VKFERKLQIAALAKVEFISMSENHFFGFLICFSLTNQNLEVGLD